MSYHFDFNFLAQLGIRLDPAGVENRNLVVFRKHFFRDHQFRESLDITRLLIDHATQLPGWPDRLLGSRQKGFLDRSHENFATDAFLPFPEFQYR